MPEAEIDQRRIWKTFSEAIGAELREATQIKGASGLDHEVQAVAVDDKTNRVIVVSAEANPRVAAMMQVDVQATLPKAKVLVARPISVDVSGTMRRLLEPLGITQIDIAKGKQFIEDIKKTPEDKIASILRLEDDADFIEKAVIASSFIDLPAMPSLMDIASQASLLPWSDIWKLFDESISSGVVDFRSILSADTLSGDLQVGVCPVPFYSFDTNDLAVFTAANRVDDAREVLKRLDIYQYFFPPADQLALALLDQGISNQSQVLSMSNTAPLLGHPFGDAELISDKTSLIETLEQLKDIGYVADGEHGLEISSSGRTVRSVVRFKPRESFISKLLSRFSVNASISPTDLLK
ncbi:hypothetical protein LQ953_15055 [Sphingomonas sp. IC-56]|uniref:hypothetical protein n=1 Tax=Sphingomonas sp. IC-56 TaxID=2898529 RepID=UPI001E3FED00|nr:hypothetical protein [Sphingomonas sp. IC-56]MCD2325339.1 hypothetical protein [Sphingomonas sp. IC-56]